MFTLTRVAAMLMHARATVFMHFSCTMMLQTVMQRNIFKSFTIHSFCLQNKNYFDIFTTLRTRKTLKIGF